MITPDVRERLATYDRHRHELTIMLHVVGESVKRGDRAVDAETIGLVVDIVELYCKWTEQAMDLLRATVESEIAIVS